MDNPVYSVIIPVYNRPDEISELLESLRMQSTQNFEVLVVEDGSTVSCKEIVEKFRDHFSVRYFYKENSGPGYTRNYGAESAKGEWLIFLDSDCHLPTTYFDTLEKFLKETRIDAFGGPDKDHETFTFIQKAISYSMTSFLTTGGIRGQKNALENFKPRSFNMGIKRVVFNALGGFRNLRFGEDIDMSLRISEGKYKTALVADAFVYHKRRTDFCRFHKQVFNSGMARIVLNGLHPGSMKVVHLLPAIFLYANLFLLIASFYYSSSWFLLVPYPVAIFLSASVKFRNVWIGVISVAASYVQLFSYGMGLTKAFCIRKILGHPIKHVLRD